NGTPGGHSVGGSSRKMDGSGYPRDIRRSIHVLFHGLRPERSFGFVILHGYGPERTTVGSVDGQGAGGMDWAEVGLRRGAGHRHPVVIAGSRRLASRGDALTGFTAETALDEGQF